MLTSGPSRGRIEIADIGSVDEDLAAVGWCKPAISDRIVLLPEPDGPTIAVVGSRLEHEVELGEHAEASSAPS